MRRTSTLARDMGHGMTQPTKPNDARNTNATWLVTAKNESGGMGQFPRRVFVVGMMVATMAGCNKMIRRGQSPDDQLIKVKESKSGSKYIRETCAIWGLEYFKTEEIGLKIR